MIVGQELFLLYMNPGRRRETIAESRITYLHMLKASLNSSCSTAIRNIIRNKHIEGGRERVNGLDIVNGGRH